MKMDVLPDLNLDKAFNILVRVPCIRRGADIITVIEESKMFKFSSSEMAVIKSKLEKKK